MKKPVIPAAVVFAVMILAGCVHTTDKREKVLIDNVDIDNTLRIAGTELEESSFGSVLGVWAIRDQVISVLQAQKISWIYFHYIDGLEEPFDIWHISWAIADFYRNGSPVVQAELQEAYDDAKVRVTELEKFEKVADAHVNGGRLYMGDIHSLGRAYAKSHIIAPGNRRYLESYDEYLEKRFKRDPEKQERYREMFPEGWPEL
jgi:hypothetical protein